jgi:hypothetical protein
MSSRIDRLVGVPEHGDRSHARQRVLPTGECPRLAVGLEGRYDFLRHLLEVGHLVEPDGVPYPDQSDLAAGHVEEKIGHGRWPGEKDGVRR